MANQITTVNADGKKASVTVGSRFQFIEAKTKAEKSLVSQAEKCLNSVDKALTAYANSYIKVCETLYFLKNSKAYKYVKNHETGKAYTDKEFNNGTFSQYYFGIDKSQLNAKINVYEKFFNIFDENGKRVPFMFGEHEAKDFSQTALIQLSALTDEEREKAVEKGIKPENTVKELKTIIDEVHKKKDTKQTQAKPKKHPCEDMDLIQFGQYLNDAIQGIYKSTAYTGLKYSTAEIDGEEITLKGYMAKVVKDLATISSNLAKYTEIQIIEADGLTDARTGKEA